MQRRAEPLRFLAVRLHQPEIGEIARRPGVNAVYRVTIQYHEGCHPDQVATLVCMQDGTAVLTVAYRRAKPTVLAYQMAADHCRALDSALRQIGFDGLDDQPDLPLLGVDFWLIERAAGSYLHDVVLAPALAEGPYAALAAAVQTHLRQAVRAIQPD